MHTLPVPDFIILTGYLLALIGIGIYFGIKKRDPDYFTKAGGKLPGWAVGLSIFGTFLSSNTFLGVPGKAYGTNWNYFVFSLTLPIAAWLAAKYFVPFYRNSGFISSYEHMESRFGPWARNYMVIGYLLTQLARMGSIMFGVALVFQALIDMDLWYSIIILGGMVTIYTLLGGIEAVIWTDVVQSAILSLGAILVLILIITDIPGGIGSIISEGMKADKFSFGNFNINFTESTFWVILLYGIFINLNNFGVDQSFIQRYHAARDLRGAGNAIWLSIKLYIPVSLFFFFIGTSLWVYYHHHPGYLRPVKERIILERHGIEDDPVMKRQAADLSDQDIGDKVFPEFMVTRVPAGLTGLLIAAFFAAAMSSIDTSLNSSATIIWSDIYKRYFNKDPGPGVSMRVLHLATLIWGILGTCTGLALIGIKSILDTWWVLSGILAGGMLGLFMLGLISKRATNHTAIISISIGLLVITWMNVPNLLPDNLGFLKSPIDINMTVVIGTLSIFLTGIVISRIKGLK